MKEGWEVKTLEQVCNKIFAGGDKPKESFSSIKTMEYSIPIYANGEKNKGLYGFTSIPKVDKPSITVSARGTVGYSEIRNEPFYPIVRLIVLTPNEKIVNLKYLQYVIGSMDFKNSGTSIPQLTVPMIKKYKSTFPPLPEQTQIVATLDKAFNLIDNAQLRIEKNIENAKELFQSKLNEIFSQQGEGWEVKNIEEISEVINGYSFKSKDFSPSNKVKSIKITNVGIKEFVEDSANNLPEDFLEKYSKVRVHEGDLVLALTRTIISDGLKVARVPNSYHNSLLNQRVAAIVPYSQIIDSDYLYYYFSSEIVYNYVLLNVNTLMQPNLSIKDLKRLKVPITNLEKQIEISGQIEDLSENTSLLINEYQQKLDNLEDLKKSILQKAFSGELTNKELVI